MAPSIAFTRNAWLPAAIWLGCGGCTVVEDLLDRVVGTDGDVGVAPTCPDDPALAGWSPVGIEGLDDHVWDLAAADEKSPIGPALYACGDFLEADGIVVNHVAKWDGNTWSALSGPNGTGVDDTCTTVAISPVDGLLHVGGAFETAGGETAFRYAVWDGSAWAAGPVSFDSGTIYDIEFADITGDSAPEIVVGGSFHDGGLLLFNGLAWLDSDLLGSHGNLGPFPDVGVGDADSEFSFVSYVKTLHADGNDLYVGGAFAEIGGLAATNIAALTSLTSFATLDDGIGWADNNAHVVQDLAVDGSGDLYAGGFLLLGAIPIDFLGRWDGSSWSGAGLGTDRIVEGLLTADIGDGLALYVAGFFTAVGSTPPAFPDVDPPVSAQFVARYENGVWSPLGSGPGPVDKEYGAEYANHAMVLETWDDGEGLCLYVGGKFRTAGDFDADNIARWCCSE